jgi:predicted 3-demethylubiquinone-9 3-methyltransferase (glyoxalase superfamily)
VLDRTGDDSSARLPSVGDIIDAHDVIDAPEETTAVPRIIPNLWFDDQALEAAEFYCSVFPNSRITNISYYGEGGMRPAGMVLTVEFELDGQRHTAINGGPQFTFDEAISFLVDCADQAEVDRYWHGLIDGGGEPGRCGWLVDRFGLSWQIIPQAFVDYTSDRDGAKVGRVMQAMLAMQKMDVAALTAAYEG